MIAVLVSGGIDSTVAYHLAIAKYGKENVKGIFVNYAQPYFLKEEEAIEELFFDGLPIGSSTDKVIVIEADLCSKQLNNVPTVEKQEIFGRNLLMAFYGAIIGDRVWLSVLENELHQSVPDKHPEFFHMCSALFTYTMKNRRNETIVETPFYEMTKSDVVELGLLLGISKEKFLRTVSCYDGETVACGKCLACFKRKVAWINNDIEEEFQVDPFDNDYAKNVIPRMQGNDKHYSAKRVVETHNALVRVGRRGIKDCGIIETYRDPELLTWVEGYLVGRN